MITKRKIIILLLAIGALTSCKKPSVEENWDVTLEATDVVAIPLSMFSCKDIASAATTPSLGEASANFKAIKILWSGQDDLQVLYMTVKLKGNTLKDGVFEMDIKGDDVAAIFGALSTTIPKIAVGATPTLLTTGCQLRIGGVAFADPTLPGFALGKLTIYAIVQRSDGTQEIVSTSADLSVKYYGKPQ